MTQQIKAGQYWFNGESGASIIKVSDGHVLTYENDCFPVDSFLVMLNHEKELAYFNTLEEAKAWANAHYKAYVKSMLETKAGEE